MLAGAQASLKSDKAWMLKTRQNFTDADAKLDKAFSQLLAN